MNKAIFNEQSNIQWTKRYSMNKAIFNEQSNIQWTNQYSMNKAIKPATLILRVRYYAPHSGHSHTESNHHSQLPVAYSPVIAFTESWSLHVIWDGALCWSVIKPIMPAWSLSHSHCCWFIFFPGPLRHMTSESDQIAVTQSQSIYVKNVSWRKMSSWSHPSLTQYPSQAPQGGTPFSRTLAHLVTFWTPQE
jgi:hypothetical protein